MRSHGMSRTIHRRCLFDVLAHHPQIVVETLYCDFFADSGIPPRCDPIYDYEVNGV